MVIGLLGSEEQLEDDNVYVKYTTPALWAVTTPELVIVATVISELCQTPPDSGWSVVLAPTQIVEGPVILATGLALTVTGDVGTDEQPVLTLVNVKLAVPAATP